MFFPIFLLVDNFVVYQEVGLCAKRDATQMWVL